MSDSGIANIFNQTWFTTVFTAIITIVVIAVIATFLKSEENRKKQKEVNENTQNEEKKNLDILKSKIQQKIALEQSQDQFNDNSSKDGNDISSLPKSEQLKIAKIDHENKMKFIKDKYNENNDPQYIPGDKPDDFALQRQEYFFKEKNKERQEILSKQEQKENDQKSKIAKIKIDENNLLTEELLINDDIKLTSGITIYTTDNPQNFIVNCYDREINEHVRQELLSKTNGLPYAVIDKKNMTITHGLNTKNFILNSISSIHEYEVIDEKNKFYQLEVEGHHLSSGDTVVIARKNLERERQEPCFGIITKDFEWIPENIGFSQKQLEDICKKRGLIRVFPKDNDEDEYWIDTKDYGRVMQITKINEQCDYYKPQLMDANKAVELGIITGDQLREQIDNLFQHGKMPCGWYFWISENDEIAGVADNNRFNKYIKDYWIDDNGYFNFKDNNNKEEKLDIADVVFVGQKNTRNVNAYEAKARQQHDDEHKGDDPLPQYKPLYDTGNNIFLKDCYPYNVNFGKIYARKFCEKFQNNGNIHTSDVYFLAAPIDELIGNVNPKRTLSFKDICVEYDEWSNCVIIGDKTTGRFTIFDLETCDFISYKEVGQNKEEDILAEEQTYGVPCFYNIFGLESKDDNERNEKMTKINPLEKGGEGKKNKELLERINRIAKTYVIKHKFDKTCDNGLYIWNGINITAGLNCDELFSVGDRPNAKIEKERSEKRKQFWDDIVFLKENGYDLNKILPENIELLKNDKKERIFVSYKKNNEKKIITHIVNIDETSNYKGSFLFHNFDQSIENNPQYINILPSIIKKYGEDENLYGMQVKCVNYSDENKRVFLYNDNILIKDGNSENIKIVYPDGSIKNIDTDGINIRISGQLYNAVEREINSDRYKQVKNLNHINFNTKLYTV